MKTYVRESFELTKTSSIPYKCENTTLTNREKKRITNDWNKMACLSWLANY